MCLWGEAYFDNAANHKVANFGGVSRAERANREEFVGFGNGARDAGNDFRAIRAGCVGAVSTALHQLRTLALWLASAQ